MKILIQYFYGGGGAVEHLKILINAYMNSFPEDELVLLTHVKAEINSINDNNPKIRILKFGGKRNIELERYILLKWKIKKIIKSEKIDLVWSVNIGAYSKLEVPQVYSIHNAYQVYPLNNISQFKANFWELIKLRALRYFTTISIKNADALTVQTELMKRIIQEKTNKPIHITSKAVDNSTDYKAKNLNKLTDNETILKLVKSKHTTKILYIANLYSHKNHEILLKAFNIISISRSDIKLIFTVDETEILSQYGKLAKNLIEKNVLWCVGWIPKRYVESLYFYTDYCAIPTLMESFSSAHIEAMKYKKPIITSDLPFCHDICGDAALYSNPLIEEDWVKNILLLENNTEATKKLVIKGLNKIKEFPGNWKDVAFHFNSIFKNI